METQEQLQHLALLQQQAEEAIKVAEDYAREHDLDYKLYLCGARYVKIENEYQLDYVGGEIGDWVWATSSTFC